MDSEENKIASQTFSNTLFGAEALESCPPNHPERNGLLKPKDRHRGNLLSRSNLVDFLASSKELAPFNPSIYQFNPKLDRNQGYRPCLQRQFLLRNR